MDEIDVTVHDHRAIQAESRVAILAAIERVAAEHGGEVHISYVRPLLPSWVAQEQIGAVICWLVRRHVLVGTERYLPNGGTRSRNRTKPAEVRYLSGPLPVVAA